jgi:hypothetical protein
MIRGCVKNVAPLGARGRAALSRKVDSPELTVPGPSGCAGGVSRWP